MAITHVTIDATALTTGDTTIYTVGNAAVCKSVAISVYNGEAGNVIVTVHKVESGGSVGATKIIATKTIATLVSTVIDEVSVQTLDTGDFLSMTVDTGTAVIAAGGATEVSS